MCSRRTYMVYGRLLLLANILIWTIFKNALENTIILYPKPKKPAVMLTYNHE